jgi:aspartyl-tRNA synthetase
MLRTHTCGVVNHSLCTQLVTLCGWVRARRDHGGIIFMDLWDREGQVQIVFHPAQQAIFQQAEQLGLEDVIQITGKVQARPSGTENQALTSGSVEVIVHHLRCLNTAESLAFSLHKDSGVNEGIALQHRYLDLRRTEKQAYFKLRTQAYQLIRKQLEQAEFWEVETPILTRATPEGARDYLVPSRTHWGKYFALPQSPQLFKQLLMVAGFDRYYQIARCFRDEDLRADRQPEFTQLDLEMAFVEESDVQTITAQLIRTVFKQLLAVDLPDPFPHLTYTQALQDYGTDKPDLRFPLKLVELADLVKTVEFPVFSAAACDPKSRVVALRLPGGAALSRRELEAYTHYVVQRKAQGLAWLKYTEAGIQSPIAKHIPTAVLTEILTRTEMQIGDILFFGAGPTPIVNASLGALRAMLGKTHQLMTTDWAPVWIVDFPLLAWDDLSNRWEALHHPFTAPKAGEAGALWDSAPGECLARAYDLVLNGIELGGGSIRIHQAALQARLFDLLKISPEEAQEKFGFLLEALKSGCPPHGGIALGLDRLIMLMSGADSIREVIAFPKTQTAQCLLTGAPSSVQRAQLQELGLYKRDS